ncbi:unnamed protein product, partial [Heterotrigona itama]
QLNWRPATDPYRCRFSAPGREERRKTKKAGFHVGPIGESRPKCHQSLTLLRIRTAEMLYGTSGQVWRGLVRVTQIARRRSRKKEGIRRIRVTPRNNEFQHIFTSGRENKKKLRNAERWRHGRGSPPESSSSVSFSSR